MKEDVFFVHNNFLHFGHTYSQAVDVGGSMFVHTFGAYFGLALSRVLHIGDIEESDKEGSAYHSDIFSMIGNWVFMDLSLSDEKSNNSIARPWWMMIHLCAFFLIPLFHFTCFTENYFSWIKIFKLLSLFKFGNQDFLNFILYRISQFYLWNAIDLMKLTEYVRLNGLRNVCYWWITHCLNIRNCACRSVRSNNIRKFGAYPDTGDC